jgi:hypothetical protein
MEMFYTIEVFRTDVKERNDATALVREIEERHPYLRANFDLDDCDRILRVMSNKGPVRPSLLIDLLKEFGFHAEILPDEEPLLSDHRQLRALSYN